MNLKLPTKIIIGGIFGIILFCFYTTTTYAQYILEYETGNENQNQFNYGGNGHLFNLSATTTITFVRFKLNCSAFTDCHTNLTEYAVKVGVGLSPTCQSSFLTNAQRNIGPNGTVTLVDYFMEGVGCELSPGAYLLYNWDGTNNISFGGSPTLVNMIGSTVGSATAYLAVYSGNAGGTDTRIIINSPTASTTSKIFDVNFEYYLNSETPKANEFNYIIFQLCSLAFPNDNCHRFSFTPTTINNLNNETIELTATRDGYHLLLANFWNGVEENTTCPWWNLWCAEQIIEIGPGTSQRFNVATTTVVFELPQWIEDADMCGALSGFTETMMCNALTFLFVPNPNSLNRFGELQSLLATKQPFGFFFMVKENINNAINSDFTAGESLVINLGENSIGNFTVFNFENAKTTFNDFGFNDSQIIQIMLWFPWIFFGIYIWFRFIKKNEEI